MTIMTKDIKELLIEQVEALDKKFYETKNIEEKLKITEIILQVYSRTQELESFAPSNK